MISRKRKRHQRNGKRSQHRKFKVYVMRHPANEFADDEIIAFINDSGDYLAKHPLPWQMLFPHESECEG